MLYGIRLFIKRDEFMDIKTGVIYPSWGLHIGQEVRPLLTTGSGFLRYGMKDKMKVVDFIHHCPCFEFLGRMDGTDMVGEKLSTDVALDLINKLSFSDTFNTAVRPLSLLAIPGSGETEHEEQKPVYLLLCEIDIKADDADFGEIQAHLAAVVEAELQKHFHYTLARDLGQLSHAQVHCAENARELYLTRGQKRGMVTGNIKVEPLVLWDGALPFDRLSRMDDEPLANVTKPIQHSLEGA